MADATARRAHVKVDRYAMFDLIAELHFTTTDYAVLDAITRLVDFRSHEWNGTVTELAGRLRASTNTIRKTLDRFDALGLIEFTVPFRPHAVGTVKLLAYDLLVVPERRPTTPHSLTASLPRGAAKAQVSDPEPRSTARLESGSGAVGARKETGLPSCFRCGDPAVGKDHNGAPVCWRHVGR